jgi:hypothetical protein
MQSVWTELVDQTRTEARQSAALAELYVQHILPLIGRRQEDIVRVGKKVVIFFCLIFKTI